MREEITPQQMRRLLSLLFAVQFVSMGAMEMSGPFWPLHLRTLAHSEVEFAAASIGVYIAPMLGIALTGAFWGRIGDRFGHKPMMIRALLGLALTQLALAFAGDATVIVALRFVQGACAGYIAPAQAYGVGIVTAERRGRLFALLQVSTNMGSLGGAVAGGWILDRASFFWINAGAALICAASALVVMLALPSMAHQSRVAAAMTTPAASSWRNSSVAGLLFALSLLLASRMLTQAPFALYVTSVFQAAHWLVGLCYGLLSLGFILSAGLWARHFEGRTSADALRRIGAVALACSVLTALIGITRDVALFALCYLLWGMLLGATTPVLTSLISRGSEAIGQGRVLGLAQSVSQLSSIAGIAVGGWFSQTAGLQSIYYLVALFYGAAALTLSVLRRETPGTAGREVPREVS